MVWPQPKPATDPASAPPAPPSLPPALLLTDKTASSPRKNKLARGFNPYRNIGVTSPTEEEPLPAPNDGEMPLVLDDDFIAQYTKQRLTREPVMFDEGSMDPLLQARRDNSKRDQHRLKMQAQLQKQKQAMMAKKETNAKSPRSRYVLQDSAAGGKATMLSEEALNEVGWR